MKNKHRNFDRNVINLRVLRIEINCCNFAYK